MGNQQERLSNFEVGWLAGVLDGEGYLSLGVNSTKRTIYPSIKVASIDRKLIDKYIFLLKKLKIPFSTYERNPKNKNWSRNWSIDIRTAERCKRFIEVILPYLTTKKYNGEIVLKFCKSRLSLPYGSSYTKEEMECLREVRKMNFNKGAERILNDYTPSKRPRYRLKI